MLDFQRFFNNLIVIGIIAGFGYIIYAGFKGNRVSLDFHFMKTVFEKMRK